MKAFTLCHPERGLIFALKREDQPRSKDPYALITPPVDSGNSLEKIT
jgi:hypothetical protein